MTALPLARFDAVSLDDLVADAALLTRVDRKYIVPRATPPDCSSTLDAGHARARDRRRSRLRLRVGLLRHPRPAELPDGGAAAPAAVQAAHPQLPRHRTRHTSRSRPAAPAGRPSRSASEYDPRLRRVLTDAARDDVADAFDAIGVDGERAGELVGDAHHPLPPRDAARAGRRRPRHDRHRPASGTQPTGGGFALPDVVIVETKSPAAASVIDRCCGEPATAPRPSANTPPASPRCTPDLPATAGRACCADPSRTPSDLAPPPPAPRRGPNRGAAMRRRLILPVTSARARRDRPGRLRDPASRDDRVATRPPPNDDRGDRGDRLRPRRGCRARGERGRDRRPR